MPSTTPAKRRRVEVSNDTSSVHGYGQQTPVPLPANYLAAMGRTSTAPVPPRPVETPVETPVPVPDVRRFAQPRKRRATGSLPPLAASRSTSRAQAYLSPAPSSSPRKAPATPNTAYQPAPSSSPPRPAARTYVPVPAMPGLRGPSSAPNTTELRQMMEDLGPENMAEVLVELMTDYPSLRTAIKKKNYGELLESSSEIRRDAEADEATEKAPKKAARKRDQAKARKDSTQVVSFDRYSTKAFNILNKDPGSQEHTAGLNAASSIEKMFRKMVDKMDQPASWGTRFNAIETMRVIFSHLCNVDPGDAPTACRENMRWWIREFMRGFDKLALPELYILAMSSNGKWRKSFEGTVNELKAYGIEGSLTGALQKLESYANRPVEADGIAHDAGAICAD